MSFQSGREGGQSGIEVLQVCRLGHTDCVDWWGWESGSHGCYDSVLERQWMLGSTEAEM